VRVRSVQIAINGGERESSLIIARWIPPITECFT